MSTPHSTNSKPGDARDGGSRLPALTADDFVLKANRQLWSRTFWAAVIALVIGVSLILAMDFNFFALPFIVLLTIVVPIVLWHYPRAMLYITVGAACLIELLPTDKADAITDRIPFFWNINTIFQTFLHVNFKAVPLNLFEAILLVAGLCSLFRSVFSGTVKLQCGPSFWPIVAYLVFVCIALANGMTSGGDFKIALQETRAQFYFLLAYLMAINLVKNRFHVERILWIAAITIAIKGLLYTFRRYVTLGGLPVPDQGVGSHEEAFFFDCFLCLLISILVCGVRPKLRNFMILALPLVELGNLATNRRAGTAAIAILVPIVFLAAYQGFPKRRRMVMIIGVTGLILGSAYYTVFKNSGSAIAQPARAIHSQFQPDARDASSNQYRDAENADQMATIRSAPLGFGYGKHFLHVVPIADISTEYEWWDLLPHNNILWVWMRTGTLGFFAFWIMISHLIIRNCMCFRDDTISLEYRSIGLFALMIVGCQLVFGLLDLQLVNFRDMVMTGILCGLAANVQQMGRAVAATAATPLARRNA